MNIIIFTDLDGCLLDEQTYQWDAAAAALDALRCAHIPLVLASSKTRAEMVPLAHALRLGNEGPLRAPLIIENGSAVLMPEHWAAGALENIIHTSDGAMVALGTLVGTLREALRDIAAVCGVQTRTFSMMSEEEISARTGLSADAVTPARQREFDVPFVLTNGSEPLDTETNRFMAAEACLRRTAEARGLRVTRGGRFLHLTGDTDKGRAAALVLRWYAEKEEEKRCLSSFSHGPREKDDRHLFSSSPFSVALGDSPNDLSLLELVDQPIIVPRASGGPHPELTRALPHAIIAAHPGPVGWNQAVHDVLKGR